MVTKLANTADATQVRTASVLAFERKLDPSDALFHAGRWDDRARPTGWQPVELRVKSVRGTISNRLAAKQAQDTTKLDAAIDKPNLQTVDVATLPPDADTLRVRFTLRVLDGAGRPSACNSASYRDKLAATVSGYVEEQGFAELAKRYAHNLAAGRFLWRNRIGAEQVDVRIERLVEGRAAATWTFADALALPVDGFDAPADDATQLDALTAVIADGLSGRAHVLLRISGYARLGNGQDVYPSQELILKRESADNKSRTLYDVNGTAALHSQKVGNAIRTIDTWHGDERDVGPIPVEPYGSVTTLGKAFRPPAGRLDFYSLLDGWVVRDQVPPVEQQHFVIANLIRGGVFGDADKA